MGIYEFPKGEGNTDDVGNVICQSNPMQGVGCSQERILINLIISEWNILRYVVYIFEIFVTAAFSWLNFGDVTKRFDT